MDKWFSYRNNDFSIDLEQITDTEYKLHCLKLDIHDVWLTAISLEEAWFKAFDIVEEELKKVNEAFKKLKSEYQK